MSDRFAFNRLELAGSLGDLGTLLPMLIGMILINGLNPIGLLLTVGLFYILGITLAINLAVGFVIGIAMAYALRSDRLDI